MFACYLGRLRTASQSQWHDYRLIVLLQDTVLVLVPKRLLHNIQYSIYGKHSVISP